MAFSKNELKHELKDDHAVKVAGIDADGILRGKIISKSKFESIIQDGFGFCSVIFGWDMHDRTYSKDLKISNAENGYRDLIAKVDLQSYRRIPWENNIPFFLITFHDLDSGEPIAPCPRSLLKSVADKYLAKGIKCFAGAELEFYQYRETAESVLEKNGVGLTPLTTGMFGYSIQRPTLNQEYYYDILESARKFNVELEGWHTETGPGVFEAAIGYSEATEMADKAILFKLICKSLGPKYSVLPCFMAKPQQGLPGNSGHLHVSLVNEQTKKNLFSRSTPDPNPPFDGLTYLSDTGRHFLAGVLAGLGDIMPLLAPTINSYKRLVENFWAPVSVSWGLEHRIASIRLISPQKPDSSSTRFEIRTPGADVNSHYALAAIYALGLRGIENKIPLTTPPMGKDAKSIKGYELLPRSLAEATVRFAKKGSLARQVLGDDFVDHFSETRFEEISQWNDAVTNWEVCRYLETV
jgi:glutamine synthetase